MLGQVEEASGLGPSFHPPLHPSLPQPSGHHGDVACPRLCPLPFWTQLFFPLLPPHPQLQALQSQVEFLEQSMVDKSLVSRQEAKIRELETRLEFEKTQVKRLEVGLTSPGPL